LKNILLWLAKIGFSVGILGFLIWKAQQHQQFAALAEHPKDWKLVALAAGAYLLTLFVQMFRWQLLARGLHLHLPFGEATRLGFLAQLFSFLGVGMLGGDALKTYILGKQNQGRMTEAFTSVFVDRFIGLYGLILVAGVASCFFDTSVLVNASANDRNTVQLLCWAAPLLAVVATLLGGFLLLPRVTKSSLWDVLARVPKLGGILKKLVLALRMYSKNRGTLLIAVLLSVVIHLSNASIYYFLSHALPAFADDVAVTKPSFISHLMAALLALATGALPLGALEIVFNVLYRAVSPPEMPSEQGFLLVLAFRLIQMAVASIGLYFYLRGRREVDQLMHEAQDLAERAEAIGKK
jgi:glycosyltransferase 2 family protein